MESKYLYSKLESFRGLAASMIVLFHSPFRFSENYSQFFNHCYLFVDFFFILSGFIISHSYYNKISTGLKFKTYILKRLIRIYPLHIFFLIFWVFLSLLNYLLYSKFFLPENNHLASFISNLLLLHSTGIHDYLSWNKPSWSISSELIIYIMFFYTSYYLDKKNSLLIPIVISCSIYLLLLFYLSPNLSNTFQFGYLRAIAGFYLGVFIYRIKVNHLKESGLNNKYFEPISILLSLSTISFFYYSIHIKFLCLLSFGFLLIIFSKKESSYIGLFLEKKQIVFLGKISYSIYMSHFAVVIFFKNYSSLLFGQSIKHYPFLANLIMLLTIYVISYFLYFFIEKKTVNFIKK
ncbi:MAG: hypothetical protein COB02_08435 [Candidatus Cloacimonadota bacterium]|nr:MAG: hypothetical protein COB02_08435 [Candidatus Cloacimonadota bacterium]